MNIHTLSIQIKRAPLSFRWSVAVLVVAAVILVGIIVSELYQSSIQKDRVEQSRHFFSLAKMDIEELFAEPAVLFGVVLDNPTIDKLRDLNDLSDIEYIHDELDRVIKNAHQAHPKIHGLYLTAENGTVISLSGELHDALGEQIAKSSERALLLREGELAISRTYIVAHKEVNEEYEAVMLYSTPIECRDCVRKPQIATLVALVSLEDFFADFSEFVANEPTLFVANVEGDVLFSGGTVQVPTEGGRLKKLKKDFPEDYADIIEYHGSRSFFSKKTERNYYLTTLYPGLDGRVEGIAKKLNTNYIAGDQQFWVMGYYSQ